jgi:hypothetical protein
MGFTDTKQQIANNVALYEVLGNLPKGKTTSSLESVNSKSRNLLPYFIDLLAMTCKEDKNTFKELARCEAIRLFLSILVDFFPVLLRILKEAFIRALKAGLACGTDFKLPAHPIKVKSNLKNLDYNDLLKVNQFSELGKMQYGKDATKDFNLYLKELVQSGGNGSWAGIIKLNYDKTTQDLEFGIDQSYTNPNNSGNQKTFQEFLTEYMDSIELITMEQLVAKSMDRLTGVLAANMPLSLDKLISIEKVNTLLNNLFNSDPCKAEYQIDDSYYTFSNDDLLSIETICNQKVNGSVLVDVGCGVQNISVDTDVLSTAFNEIRNSPQSEIKATLNKALNSLNDSLTANLSAKDKNTAKLNLNKNFIENLPKILCEIIFEPKMVLLYQLSAKIVKGPLSPNMPTVGQPTPPLLSVETDLKIVVPDSFNYAKATRVFFEYTARESMAALLEIIFKELKKSIINLVKDFVILLAKEQSKLKIKTLIFLTGGIVEGLLTQIPIPDTSKYV